MRALIASICLAVLLFSSVFAAEIADKVARRALIDTPDNAAAISGSRVVFHCASDSLPITWYFTRRGDTEVHTVYDGSQLSPNFIGTYDIVTESGHVDLVILNATISQVGVYRCKELSGFEPHATAAFVIMNDDPVCSTNISTSDISQGDGVEIQCRTHYTNNVSPLNMTWTDPWGSSVEAATTLVIEGDLVFYQSIIEVTAVAPSVGTYKCHTSFEVPPPDIATTAKNAPAYTYDYSSPTLNVKHCPTTISISVPSANPSPGDVLTCTSNGFPQPQYTWTHVQSGAQSTGPTLTLSAGGYHSYRCESNVTISEDSCFESTYVSVRVAASSCLEVKLDNPAAPSGRYTIRLQNGKSFEAYCEMGLNGGGYTYLSPQSLLGLTDEDIQPLFTDKSNFLLRLRRDDGTQTFGVLEQIDQNSDIPLWLGVSHTTGFYPTYNEVPNRLGRPFLYFGFLSHEQTNNDSIPLWGVQVNDVNRAYAKVAGLRNYFALFAGFGEASALFTGNTTYDHCNAILSTDQKNPPSGRVIPEEYFMFLEVIFQNTCHMTTNSQNLRWLSITNAAIGFR